MNKVLFLVMVLVLCVSLNVLAQEGLMPLPISNTPVFREPSAAFLDSVNFDSEGRGEVFSNKLGNGVINLATCWTDVPRRMNEVSEERSVLEGYTIGFGEGILLGILRGAAGTYDTATCVLPPYDEPLMQPKYSVNQPSKDGLKITLLNW